jgi:hypothetical protein
MCFSNVRLKRFLAVICDELAVALSTESAGNMHIPKELGSLRRPSLCTVVRLKHAVAVCVRHVVTGSLSVVIRSKKCVRGRRMQ